MFFGLADIGLGNLGIAKCCCQEGADETQVTVDNSIGGDAVAVNAKPAMVPVTALPALSAPSATLVPKRSADKEAEKARLQKLVNGFAKKALSGCPCVFLSESGQRVSSNYKIPKSLDTLTFTSGEEHREEGAQCRIADIQDVFCLAEDGQHVFGHLVLEAVGREERELLLMVVLRDRRKFSILEESVESRDTFLECMRILCIYAQAAHRSSSAGTKAI